jgi:hypothetical protein
MTRRRVKIPKCSYPDKTVNYKIANKQV